MDPALTHDPNVTGEQTVSILNAPTRRISAALSIQPPLSRRGQGPGLVIFLPGAITSVAQGPRPLDPEPMHKWAEEGFAVAVVEVDPVLDIPKVLIEATNALVDLEDDLEPKDRIGIVVYDEAILNEVCQAASNDTQVQCLVGYGRASPDLGDISKPLLLHTVESGPAHNDGHTRSDRYTYRVSSSQFVLPNSNGYDPGSAALAHTRSLVFLRKHLGGPYFNLEAIWEEHTYFEFEDRSVAKTMATMVAEPYVNHIPTLLKMTGGVGRENLTRFYRDHFIFSNPADAKLQVVSRTVGPDRVVGVSDEFVYHVTHDRKIDWLLPGVPATGKKLSIPMLAVVNMRGDRLYNEHIWWDQATVLKQACILPSYVSYPTPEGNTQWLRLPVAGVETAEKLVDGSNGESNEMLGEGWGVTKTNLVLS